MKPRSAAVSSSPCTQPSPPWEGTSLSSVRTTTADDLVARFAYLHQQAKLGELPTKLGPEYNLLKERFAAIL